MLVLVHRSCTLLVLPDQYPDPAAPGQTAIIKFIFVKKWQTLLELVTKNNRKIRRQAFGGELCIIPFENA